MADTTPQMDLSQFGAQPQMDMSQFAPPAPLPDRYAPTEIGVGALRGALVDMPKMVGSAAKTVGAYQTGQAIQNWSAQMGQKPWLTPNPDAHNGFTNWLAQGAENVSAGVVAPLVAGGAAAAAGVTGLPALTIGAAAGGLLMAGQTHEDTLAKAEQAGPPSPNDMQAVRLAAGKDFAIGTAAGMAGGQMLGLGGTALGKAMGAEGSSVAQGVLQQITGGNSIAGTVAKSLATGTAENVGIGMAQAGGQAAIEKAYGIDNSADPWQAAVGNILPMLAQSAILGPLGLVHQTMAIRSARDHATALASGETDADVRRNVAGQYYDALNNVDPEAAANFQKKAGWAIAAGQNLPVDPSLLRPDVPYVNPYARPAEPRPFVPEWYAPGDAPQGPPAPPPAGPPPESSVTRATMSPGFVNSLTGADLPPPADQAARDAYDKQMQGVFNEPSGVFSRDARGQEIMLSRGDLLGHQEAGLIPLPAATPEEQTANLGKLQQIHSQIVDDLKAGGEDVAQPLTLSQFRATPRGYGLKGDELQGAYQKYMDDLSMKGGDPYTQAALMREDANTWEQMKARQQAEATDAQARAGELNPIVRTAPQERENAEIAPLGTQMRDALTQAMVDRASTRQEVESGMASLRRERGAQEAETAQAAYERSEAQLEQLHGQVNDVLRNNGVRPQDVTSEDEGERNKVIGANADAFEKLFADRAERQIPPNTTSDAPPEAAPPQSQIADQLRAAMAQRDALKQQADEAAARAQAAAQDAERVSAENDKTQRIGKDAETADHETEQSEWNDARGNEPAQPTAPPATQAEAVSRRNPPRRPMPREIREALPTKNVDEVKQDLGTAMDANGEKVLPQDTARMVNKMKDAGVMDAPTHQKQVEALRTLSNSDKVTDKQQLRMGLLADHWESQLPGAVPKTNGAAEPAAEPKTNGAAEPKTNGAAGPKTNGAAEHPTVPPEVAAAIDRLTATAVDFNNRARQKEKFTPGEAARRDSVNTMRELFHDMSEKGIGHGEGQYTPNHVENMLREAKDTEKPWTDDQRAPSAGDDTHARVSDHMDEVNPDLLGPAAQTGRLADALNHLSQNGSTALTRRLAGWLARSVGEVKVVHDPSTPEDGTLGVYEGRHQRVTLYKKGMTEQTLLHEAVHAATSDALHAVQKSLFPVTQRGREQWKAYGELEQVRKDLIQALGGPDNGERYGLTDVHEMLAEMHSNYYFQRMLDTTITPKTGGSLWSRIVNAVRSLLGMPTDRPSYNALERAMASSEAFFQARRDDAEWNASPQGAARVMDRNVHSMVGQAEMAKASYDSGDQAHRRIANWDDAKQSLADNPVARKAFDFFMKFQTMQYIADRARAVPELVKSGFAHAVDAYNRAVDSRRIVSEHVEGENGKYADGVKQLLRTMPADKARDLSAQMMKLGGESSIGQFDYKLNYASNKQLHPDLNPENKDFIDGLHREFTQLQRTNPDAAKAIVDGEKLARKDLVMRFATMVGHAMDTHAGVMRRLESELGRMAPDDAERAKLEARVANSRIEGQLAAIHSPGLDMMAKDLKGTRNTAPAFHYDGTSATLASRLMDAFTAARELPEGSDLRAQIGELEHMYRPQYDNPYFSLGRNGDHFVKIAWKDMDAATQGRMQGALKGTNKVLGNLTTDPNKYAFFRFKTADEAEGIRAKLEKAMGDRYLDGPNTASGMLSDNHLASVNGITPALRMMLANMQDEYEHNDGLTREQVDTMKALTTRTLMSMLPETGSRSARMQRRGVAGYDGDFVGNFARRASASVQDLSNLYTARAFTAAHKGMKDSISQLNHTGSADAKLRAQMMQNEVSLRYANSMTRLDNGIVNQINSLGHSYYLALSPAFLIRTMAQPWHRGLPYLGSQYGAVRTAKEMAGATGAAMKVIKATMQQGWANGGVRGLLDAHMSFEGLGLTKDEEAFVREMHDRGVLNLGQSRQLQQMAIGGSPRMQDLVRFSAMTAQYAEMTNRFITGLAAYRLAMKGSGSGVPLEARTAKATEGAITAVNRVMDNFDPDNTARFLSKHGPLGKLGPLATAFMNYNFQTMQQLTRTVHDGFFGRDASEAGKLRSKQAKMEFGGLMATTFVAAGALGLPFMNAITGMYNWLTQDRDSPGDIRIDARNWMADHFGQWGGDIASHGIGGLIGMDGSTFGLENLLPGSEFLANRQKFGDRLEAQSQQLLGPAINAGIDGMKALNMISQGYVAKGIEQALPSGLKAPYKALELAGVIGHGGYTDTKGNPIPMGEQPNGWDIALQAAGFRTTARANQSEFHEYLSQNESRLQERRQIIGDRVFKATQASDPDAMQDAVGDMMRFNQHNPLMPIRGVADAVRNHYMSNALGAATGAGVPVTRQMFPVAKKEGRFAAMPDGQ